MWKIETKINAVFYPKKKKCLPSYERAKFRFDIVKCANIYNFMKIVLYISHNFCFVSVPISTITTFIHRHRYTRWTTNRNRNKNPTQHNTQGAANVFSLSKLIEAYTPREKWICWTPKITFGIHIFCPLNFWQIHIVVGWFRNRS